MKVSSFTREIKEELTLSWIDVTSDLRISLLSAFIRANGIISFSYRCENLTLEADNAQVIKFIYKQIKETKEDIDIHFYFRKTMKFNKCTRYAIEIKDASSILDICKINFLENKIPYSLTGKEDKIRAYLTGLFLSNGSCNDPSSTNYHLEISLKNEDYAKAVLKMIQKIKTKDFNFKLIKRRNNFVIYIKKSDLISDFLNFIDANDACFKFENTRMDRDLSNVTNRLINCDGYNYNKSITNAQKQIKMIDFIDVHLGIKNITNEKVRNLCYLRKEFPEYSYLELSNELSKVLEQKVSKSNINHLFRKINELAERLNYEDK